MVDPRYFVVLLLAAIAANADVPISPPAFGPATNVTYTGMSIVPLGDGFLAIWGEGPPCGDSEFRGIRLDRDGQPLDPGSFLVAPALFETSVIATAADGDDAYVAWRSYGVSAHLMRVSADGTVTKLSDSVPIARAVNMQASNGKLLFLGSRSSLSDPLTVTLVDRAGVVVRSGVTIVGLNASVMDLIAADGAFLFAWAGADGIHVTRISADDVAANNIPFTPPVLTGASASYFRLASNGVHSMASWFDSGTHEIRVLPLSAAGEPLGAPISIGSFAPAEPPAIVGVSGGFEILVRDGTNGAGELAAFRVSFDGMLQSVHHYPAIFQPAAAQNGDRTVALWSEQRFATSKGGQTIAGPIASDGSIGAGTIVSLEPVEQHVRKFLPLAGGVAALWTDSAPNDRLTVGRLTPGGAPVDGAGLRLRESIYDQRHSAMASDGERLFVAWTEGDPSYLSHVLYGAVVSFSGSPSVSVRQLAVDAGGESDVAVAWNGQTFTIVYQRTRPQSFDLAALRVDRSGNVVDPDPIPLTPARVGDESPRLSWNGSDYLLVWQRWYDPFTYIGEQCFPPEPPPLPAELFAQQFSASFTPTSAEIPLATTTNKNDYLLDVQNDDVSFAGGVWLVLWLDKAKGLTRYARMDTNGVRLDPLNGQTLPVFYDDPILVPAPDGWTVAGHEGYGPYGAGRGLALERIDINGQATALPTVPLSGTSAVEAVSLTQAPLVAFKRSTSSAAFVAFLSQRSRAAHH